MAATTKNKKATHCPLGHRYDAPNTRLTPRGWRTCRACNRIRMKERRIQYQKPRREWLAPINRRPL